MFAASFLDPNPMYSSSRFARDLGFRDRVVHPLVMLNLALDKVLDKYLTTRMQELAPEIEKVKEIRRVAAANAAAVGVR